MQLLKKRRFLLAIGLCICLSPQLLCSNNKEEKATQFWITKTKNKRLTNLSTAVKKVVTGDVKHYLYLTNQGKYRDEKRPFNESFLESTIRGSQIFYAMLTKDIDPKYHEDIIDLTNFILFAAIPEQTDSLSFSKKFALRIHLDDTLTRRLEQFFSRPPNTVPALFQMDEKNEWFSIHLRENPSDSYRNYWLGNKLYKSFGIKKSDNMIEIRPHANSGAQPPLINDFSNTTDLSLDDLIAAYLLLNKASNNTAIQAASHLMARLFLPYTTNNESYILKKTQSLRLSPYFGNYFRRLLSDYLLTRKQITLPSITIEPSKEQIKESLRQYTLMSEISTEHCNNLKEHAKKGAQIVRNLLAGDKYTYEKNSDDFEKYVKDIIDVNIFLYTLSIYLRDDGIGSANLVIGMFNAEPLKDFLYGYLNYIKECKLNIGTTKDTRAANPYAYYRKQSHQFENAFGIDTRYSPQESIFIAEKGEDLLSGVVQPSQPILFPGLWPVEETDQRSIGAQFHLLIGEDQDIADKLFIKWEKHGLYGSQFFLHAVDFIRSQATKQTLIRDQLGLTPDDSPQYNKERVPEDIITITKKSFPKDQNAIKAAKKGISHIYEYANQMGKEGVELATYIEQNYDHPDIRRGREIIIFPGRDDTHLWIDYFTTFDDGLKNIYLKFSSLKHQMIDIATERIKMEPEETLETSFIEIEKPGVETIKQTTQDLINLMEKREFWLNNKETKYLAVIKSILEMIVKLDDKALESFIKKNARIMFDIKFYDSIKKRIQQMQKTTV